MKRQKKAKKLMAALLSGLIVTSALPGGVFAIPAVADAVPKAATLLKDNSGKSYYNMHEEGNMQLDLTKEEEGFRFMLYDDGGNNRSYSSSVDSTLTIVPPSNCLLRVTGTVFTEDNYDYLYIYDGDTYSGTMVASLNGYYEEIDSCILGATESHKAAVQFHSDGSVVRDGYALEVVLINAEKEFSVSAAQNSHAKLTVDKTSAKCGDMISFTAECDDGYCINDIFMTTDSGDRVSCTEGRWYEEKSGQVAMPYGNATLDVICVKNKYRSLYMPSAGEIDVQIPDGIDSFRIIDKGNKYSTRSEPSLNLYSSGNKAFKISGTADFSNSEMTLKLSDSSETYRYSGAKGTTTEIRPAVFNENATVAFYVSGSYYSSNDNDKWADNGLMLNVKLLDKEKKYTVKATESSLGSLKPQVEKASAGEKVYVDIEGKNGSLLRSVKGVTDSGEEINIKGANWYSLGDSTSISFTMSDDNVTLMPDFVDAETAETGLSINFPKMNAYSNTKGSSGTRLLATIPTGVKSFHIFDDGGEDGDYSARYSGEVAIALPEDCYPVFTGTATLTNSMDSYMYGYSSSGGTELSFDGLASSNSTSSFPVYGTITRNIEPIYGLANTQTSVRFSSLDATDTGFDITVDVKKKDNVFSVTAVQEDHGTISVSSDSVQAGDLVSIYNEPSTGWMLTDVEVTDAKGNEVPVKGGRWYNSYCTWFNAPESDVTVTPTFTEIATVADSLSVTMPSKNKLPGSEDSISIPNGIKSFMIYDDGGKRANMSANYYANNYVSFGNCFVTISGEYTGSGTNETAFLTHSSSYGAAAIMSSGTKGETTQLEKATYTDGFEMTLLNGTADTDNNLALRATITNYGDEGRITIKQTEGGTLTGPETASYSSQVGFVAHPDKDYVFCGLSVECELANPDIEIYFDDTENNYDASFYMPTGSVTVEPVFVKKNISGEWSLTTPATGSKFVQIPDGVTKLHVYDDGGKDGDFTKNCNGSLTLEAPNRGFEYEGTLTGSASVYFSDGSSYRGDGSVWATAITPNVISSEIMKIRLTEESGLSYPYVVVSNPVREGLDLDVSLVDTTKPYNVNVNANDGGTWVIDNAESMTPAKRQVGETVYVYFNPDEKHMLGAVSVKDANGNDIPFSGDSFTNFIWFTMKSSDVTVTAEFTDDFSAEGGLFATLSIYNDIVLDKSVKSFNVYDDGGPLFNHSAYMYNRHIASPEGTVMSVVENSPSMVGNPVSISDSYSTIGTIASTNGFTGTSPELGLCVTSDNHLSFYPSNNSYYTVSTFKGLDLRVDVLDPEELYAVKTVQTEGGTITASTNAAAIGDVVTCEAVPDEGWILQEVNVKDEKGNAQTVTGGRWYTGNSATFTMCSSPVTVTPVFTQAHTAEEGLEVELEGQALSQNGSLLHVVVPDGITSFTLHSGSGNQANTYQQAAKIIAPTGYRVALNGSAAPCDENTFFAAQPDGKLTNSDANFFKTQPNSSTIEINDCESNNNALTFIMVRNDPSAAIPDLNVKVTIIPDEYTVTLNTDGGTLPDGAASTFTYTTEDDDITLPTPRLHGFLFTGWIDPSDGIDYGKTTVIPHGSIGDRSFIAEYEDSNYRYVDIHENMEIVSADGEPYTDGSGTAYLIGTKVKIRPADGYKADGALSDGTQKINPDKNGVYTITVGDADVNVTAKIVPIEYKITYNNTESAENKNPTSYNIETETFTLKDLSREGYTFTGWTTSNSTKPAHNVKVQKGTTGDLAFTANWTINKYTVTFNTNGGSKIDSAQYEYGSSIKAPAEPTKTGSTFGGWFKDKALTKKWDFAKDTVTADTTLYAKWNENPANTDSENTDTKTSDTDTKTSDTDTKTSDTDTKTSDTDTKTSDTDTKTSDTDTKTDSDTKASEDTPTGSSDTDSKTSDTDTKTSDTDTKTSDTDTKTSDTDTKEDEPIGLLGDINGDGTVDSSDALQALRASIGLAELNETEILLGDVNEDNSVDSNDALEILRFSIGLSGNDKIGQTFFKKKA